MANNYKNLVRESLVKIQQKIKAILANQAAKIEKLKQDSTTSEAKTKADLEAEQKVINEAATAALEQARQGKAQAQAALDE